MELRKMSPPGLLRIAMYFINLTWMYVYFRIPRASKGQKQNKIVECFPNAIDVLHIPIDEKVVGFPSLSIIVVEIFVVKLAVGNNH